MVLLGFVLGFDGDGEFVRRGEELGDVDSVEDVGLANERHFCKPDLVLRLTFLFHQDYYCLHCVVFLCSQVGMTRDRRTPRERGAQRSTVLRLDNRDRAVPQVADVMDDSAGRRALHHVDQLAAALGVNAEGDGDEAEAWNVRVAAQVVDPCSVVLAVRAVLVLFLDFAFHWFSLR